MDPKSLTTKAGRLDGLINLIQAALAGKWDDSSTPIVERLTYELSRLQTLLECLLKLASLAHPQPMWLAGIPSAIAGSRESLVSIGQRLFRSGLFGELLDMEDPTWLWETFDPERPAKKMPWSKNEGESFVADLYSSVSNLRTWLVMTSLLQRLKHLQV